jgi:hypothetical protein
MIYSYYNDYKITTSFTSETSRGKVKSIRELADKSEKSGISSVSMNSATQSNFFIPLSDELFAKKAVLRLENGVNTNKYFYGTYQLFIAKDNSQAFTINYVQTGKKKPELAKKYLLGINADGIKYYGGVTFTDYKVDASIYKNYISYIYTPAAGMTLTEINKKMGFAGGAMAMGIERQDSYMSPVYKDAYGVEFYTITNGYPIMNGNIKSVEAAFK